MEWRTTNPLSFVVKNEGSTEFPPMLLVSSQYQIFSKLLSSTHTTSLLSNQEMQLQNKAIYRDVRMGGGTPPDIVKLARKFVKKSAMLQESWPQYFS